jgi:hypothetical protein
MGMIGQALFLLCRHISPFRYIGQRIRVENGCVERVRVQTGHVNVMAA